MIRTSPVASATGFIFAAVAESDADIVLLDGMLSGRR
jgi:hypothetical protein